MGYIIHKRTCEPGYESYSGSTWDRTGVRHLWKPVYKFREVAKSIADMLSLYNPVGFTVTEVKEKK